MITASLPGFALFVFLVLQANAQSITGSIAGVVKDPGNLAMSGVDIVLTNTRSGAQRKAQSLATGGFVFQSLQPGEYSLSIQAAGFKKLERAAINLSASEALSLGDLRLEIGSVSESITVQSEGAMVQTVSSERSGLVTSSQVDNLLIKGRNVTSLLQLMPGVVDTADSDAVDRNFGIGLNISGGRRNSTNVTVDGMTVVDAGNNWISVLNISMDAVAEVKALTSNYQAEYGRMSGANVQIVTKSGTRDFHGMASYFKRHEQFNANNFFNNLTNIRKGRYRYNTWSYNVGGPVYIPGKFNTSKDKLFFFWSQEFWPQNVPVAATQITVPTELERAGDFSQSRDLNGALIPVLDPVARTPFPGNMVPASRIDPNGQALLKFLPLPNFFDTAVSARRYNYVYQPQIDKPQQMRTLKLDYNATPNDIFSFNFSQQEDKQTGTMGLATANSNWPQFPRTFWTRGTMALLRYQKLFSPTLINEFTFGYNQRPEEDRIDQAALQASQRNSVGFKAGQLYPDANPLNLLPNATFAGVTNPVNINMDKRTPAVQNQHAFNFVDNITKTLAKHTLKAGILVNRVSRDSVLNSDSRGIFAFDRDVNNPLDTGYSFANALTGVFSSYQEASAHVAQRYYINSYEWFAQDSWKALPRLTLEMGLRFSYMPATYTNGKMAGFDPALWDASKAVQLIRPALVNGKRMGLNPATGTVYPAVQIGAIVPGSGNPSNGMALSTDPGYPQGLRNGAGVDWAPRFGFAWDVFGNGRTAVRGGFGMFYNIGDYTQVAEYGAQTPLVVTPMINYGTLSNFLSSAGLVFPQNVTGLSKKGYDPLTMNLSFSVQHRVGLATVLDAAYVGSLSRHLLWMRELSPIPMGAYFVPGNADPTNPAVPLSAPFLRSLPGYNTVNQREWASSSNYHSMQVSANRRFARNFQFGASWTWSKSMGFNDYDNNAIATLVSPRVWNYGLSSFDRTHVFKLNYLFDVPKTPWKTPVANWALNGWQISGITSFVSGAPASVGYALVTPKEITGTPSQSARVVVTGNPVLPKSERTFNQNFRTDVFQAPAVGTIGNSARTILRGPGINNWDAAIFKTLPIREPLKLQFRCELYNAFNHTQFSAFDTTARFNAQGQQVNAGFGRFTAARNPRILQFALRFAF